MPVHNELILEHALRSAPSAFRPALRRHTAWCRHAAGVTLALALLGETAGGTPGPSPSTVSKVGVPGDVFAEPQPFSGTTVHVSTSGSDANAGDETTPVRTLQRGVQLASQVNAEGRAVRVLIGAGVYHETVRLAPGQGTQAAMVLEGTGDSTVVTGADRWTDWTTQADGSILHDWPYRWGSKPIPSGWEGYWTSGGNGSSRDILRRSEMVYVNGEPLRGVLALSQLMPGTFYVDETAGRLHARLPSGILAAAAIIDVGIRDLVFDIVGRRNLTLRNIVAMRSRGAVQDTGVRIANSQNITVDNVHVRWMAYAGFGTSSVDGLQIRNSVFSDNGVVGMGGWRDRNVLVEDTEIARNNWRGEPASHKDWDDVHKISQVRDFVARRLRVVDNRGNGFWADYDNQRVTLQDSVVSGNRGRGVYLEKNQGPILVERNRVCGNEVGIGDAQSAYVTLRDNEIFDNAKWNILFTGNHAGQSVVDHQTGHTTLVRTRYWSVSGNTVIGNGSEGWLWWQTDAEAWAESRGTMVLADGNRWFHTSRPSAFRLPQGSVAHPAFSSSLQRANPAHEVDSVWGVTSTLRCTQP